MKIQKLFLSILAAASLFAGCKEPEPEPTIPSLTVGQTELSFEQGGGTGNITVTSNRPWTISTDADWLAFNPSSGNAADAPVSVTVTALSNNSNDRTSSFKVKTDFDFKTVTVSQKGQKGEDPNVTPSGSGTAADPYNVAAALQKAQSLVAYNNGDDLGTQNSATVYTKGKVVSVEVDPSYGNASYFISADGTAETQLEVYRGKYLNGENFLLADQLKVGDEVVVYGTLVNFKGTTPEYTAGSKLISINGSTEPAKIDFTKLELITVQAFIDKADKAHFYRLKGTVSRFNKEYCSFDLTDDSGKIYVYSVNNKDEWVDKIKNGGTVELAGLYTYYEKNSQHEVVSAQILSFEEGQGEDYENAEPKSVDEFISAADKNTYFKLTGTVSGFNSQFCSFDITDESGSIYVYSVANKADWASKISNGGTVTLAGKYDYYESKSQHEVVNAQILSFEAGEQEDYSGATAKTVADFISSADKENHYKLTGTVSGFNEKYCSFDVEDETGKIYVYSVANKADWASKISNGGTVVLAGKYDYYESKSQHEVIDAYILSFEAAAPPESQEATVAEAIEAAKDAVLKVGPAFVVASSEAGFLMEQDGAKIYVYGGKAKVGDNVTVEATRAEYQGVPQLASPKVTVNSEGAEITYPTAKDITSSFASYSSETREYVTFKGKLNISGNYYNIDVDGSSSVTGSIPKPVEDIASLNGKDVTITGYYLYHTSQGKYLYVIPTKVNDIVIAGAGDDNPGGDTPGGEVSGNTETVDFSSKGYANAEAVSSYKGTNFTIAFDKGTNNNAPKYYNTGTAVRVYGSNNFTISSSKTITSIKFTFSSGEGTNELTADKGTFTKDTWTGSATSVKFTVGGTSGHRRIKMIAVTFAE